MKNYKFILNAFLVGITIFSVFRYSVSLKEKYDLLNSLNQTKEEVATLQTEKQNLLGELEQGKELQQQLTQKNTRLKDNLRAASDRLTKLFTDFEETRNTVEQLNSQGTLLKAENTALREEKNNLELEKENLKARLGSIAELKKAIRELKIKMRQVKVEIKEKPKTEEIIEGNYGFLIKDGKPTYPTRVRIKVVPLPQQEQ
jgi:chromosome segregation ATPase